MPRVAIASEGPGGMLPCAMTYEFDIYVSHTGEGVAARWAQETFLPQLGEALALEDVPRMFTDRPLGLDRLSPRQEAALLHSKCLLAVWSPSYFASAVCMAEWTTMLGREESVEGTEIGRRFVVGILFAGEWDLLPSEARRGPAHDCRDFSALTPALRETPVYLAFEGVVQRVSRELTEMMLHAPDWRSDWLVRYPEPIDLPAIPLPRLA